MNNPELQKKADQFVKRLGYDYANYVTDWNGAKVYSCELEDSDEGIPAIGMIRLVLAFKTKIRTTTLEETGTILRTL